MPSAECCKRTSMKIIQIALNVISIALVLKYNCVPTLVRSPSFGASMSDWFTHDYTRTYLSIAVAGGFFVISTITLLAYAIEGMSKAPILETLMMIVGSALSFTAGGLILDVFINYTTSKGEFRDSGIAFGSLQVVNGLAYLIDAFFVFKK